MPRATTFSDGGQENPPFISLKCSFCLAATGSIGPSVAEPRRQKMFPSKPDKNMATAAQNAPVTSSAECPDLDWSQIRETVVMINVAIARIQHAMDDGSDSVAALTESFMSMIAAVKDVHNVAETLGDGDAKHSILEDCEHIEQRTQAAIVAFQFYDRLTQRLHHCSNSLHALNELISRQDRLYNPNAWANLQAQVRARFTLDSDQKLLAAVLAGTPIDEAIAQLDTDNSKEDAIELF